VKVFFGDVAQLARALDWQSRGRKNETLTYYFVSVFSFGYNIGTTNDDFIKCFLKPFDCLLNWK